MTATRYSVISREIQDAVLKEKRPRREREERERERGREREGESGVVDSIEEENQKKTEDYYFFLCLAFVLSSEFGVTKVKKATCNSHQ